MTDGEAEMLRKRDAMALAQLLYDIYIGQKQKSDELDVTR